MADRFIIEFHTNINAALAALDRLAAKVQQVEAAINATINRATTGVGTAGGPLPAGFSRNVDDATKKLEALAAQQKATATGMAAGATAATGMSGNLGKLAANATLLTQTMGGLASGSQAQARVARQAFSAWRQYGASMTAAGLSNQQAVAQMQKIAPVAFGASNAVGQMSRNVNASTDSFARHAARIAETALVYGTLFTAVAAAKSALDLSVAIDRESRRLEAVIGIGPELSKAFVGDLADIAVQTATPLEDIISNVDQAASAFLDLPAGVERSAATLELMSEVGKFTTVTQRDVATETENLVAIMKQFNIPAAQMGDFLGKIVVAGGNASDLIIRLSDALQISARSASQAGVDLDTLLALESAFAIQTGRTGNEVGTTFQQLFTKMAEPSVVDNVEEITGGLLKMRDAAGKLRDPFQVLIELNALLDKGLINTTQFSDVLGAITPPLAPQRLADFQIIVRLLREVGPAVAEIGQADTSALDELVGKINAALGPQFRILIEEAKRAFVDLFEEDVVNAGQGLIDLVRSIGSAIGSLPPDVIRITVEFLAFATAMRAIVFVGPKLLQLLGLGGITGMLRGGASAAAGASTAFGLFGRTLFTASGAVAFFARGLGILLPLVASFMAVDFVGKIGEQQQGLRELIGGEIVGSTVEDLKALRERIISQLSDTQRLNAEQGLLDPQKRLQELGFFGSFLRGIGGTFDIKNFTTNGPLLEALAEVDKQIAALEQSGGQGKVGVDSLSESFKEGIDPAAEYERELESQRTEYERMMAAAQGLTESIAGVSAQEQIAAQASELQLGLANEMTSAFESLSDRLRDGKISFEEYTQGVEQVNRASELASQLVAAAGDELAKVPQLAGAAAEGNDALAQAIFRMIASSTDQFPLIDQLIGKIVGIAGAAAAAAATAAANPILIRTIILPPERVAAGGGIPEFAGDPGLGKPGGTFVRPLRQPSVDISQLNSQIQTLVNTLIKQLVGGTSGTFGVGPTFSGSGAGSRAGATRRQTDVLDIGDLGKKDIAKIIEIATKLRNRIPGARQDSEDAVVALIKDAQFLKTVRGIDDRLLRLAIEQLTDQMEQANRREEEKARRDQLLRNLVVRTGPLGALVSQPTAFGVAGSLAQGNGLNFNPNQGNFVINVPVELKGLEPKRLQQLIYNIISKAIRDSLRL